jgi:2-succinyl-6-hydroxy-2,4-cyclohexadiene-1-carboxylate synthase
MIHALHGNLGAVSDWDGLLRELPLVPVDLWSWLERDPDLSPGGFGEQWSAEVAAIDPAPVLLGYSLGGRLALRAVAARPDLWKAAILVSTHPGLETDAECRERLTRDREWARRAREDDWQSFLDAWNAQPTLSGQPVNVEGQRALERRREAVARGFENWSLGHQRAMEGVIADAGIPVLWVAGERDERFSSLARRAVDASPVARCETIAGAGHRLVWERPLELAAGVRAFLSERGLIAEK